MLDLVLSNRFKKDLKTIMRRGYNLDLMEEIVDTLLAQGQLDEKYHDHPLSGDYHGFRECHIAHPIPTRNHPFSIGFSGRVTKKIREVYDYAWTEETF